MEQVSSLHNDEKPGKCILCENYLVSFLYCKQTNKIKLTCYNIAVHMGETSYQRFLCIINVTQTMNRQVFLNFVMAHKGEKPHMCRLCVNRFYLIGNIFFMKNHSNFLGDYFTSHT